MRYYAVTTSAKDSPNFFVAVEKDIIKYLHTDGNGVSLPVPVLNLNKQIKHESLLMRGDLVIVEWAEKEVPENYKDILGVKNDD